jgi:hypothetical protein
MVKHVHGSKAAAICLARMGKTEVKQPGCMTAGTIPGAVESDILICKSICAPVSFL